MVKIKTQIVVYKKAHVYKAYNQFLVFVFFFNYTVLSKFVICVRPCSHVTTCGPQTTGWICMHVTCVRPCSHPQTTGWIMYASKNEEVAASPFI